MELRNLLTFLKIVETGSFSKAAEQLLYSQSTVTIQIQQLEEELNVLLFERIGKRVYVTEKGRDLAEYARQILEITQKISLLNAESGELQGTLTIVSIDSLMSAVLPSLLAEYHKRHPKVSIVVKITDSMGEMERFLSQNEADLSFVFLEKQGWKDLNSAFFRKDRTVFCTYPSHPLAKKKNISLEELSREDIVVSNKHSFFTEMLSSQSKSLCQSLAPAFDIWNTTATLEMVKLGTGIVFLPYYLVARAVEQGEVCVLDVPEVNDTIWVQALYHQNKMVTPQMEAFFSLLHEKYPD